MKKTMKEMKDKFNWILSFISGWLAKIVVRYILIAATLFFGANAVESANDYGFNQQVAIELVSSVVFLSLVGFLERKDDKDKKTKEDTIDKLIDVIEESIDNALAKQKVEEKLKPEQKKAIKKIKSNSNVV